MPAKLTPSERTDRLVTKTFAPEKPGAAVMVILHGKIAYQSGRGLANLQTQTPLTPKSLFHLASASKQFTAMGIMLLAQAGKLKFDQPAGQLLPELKRFGSKFTIRALLNHTSGIPDYYDNDRLYNKLLEISPTPGNADILRLLKDEGELVSDPGDRFSYSNPGYDTLGALIERLSGQSYPDFMQTHIFNPLGMRSTFSLPNPKKRAGPLVTQSYSGTRRFVAYEPDPFDAISGAGSTYTNLEDLYLYDRALNQGTLLAPEIQAEALKPARLNNGKTAPYGFGWEVDEYNGYFYVGHSGAWLGYLNYYLRVPEYKLAVVVLTNRDTSDPESLAFEIAELYM